VKDRITDAVLVAPDRPKEGGNIPHLGFGFRGKKVLHLRVPPEKGTPHCKNGKQKKARNEKSAKKSAKKITNNRIYAYTPKD
jgi:hypothetical protein